MRSSPRSFNARDPVQPEAARDHLDDSVLQKFFSWVPVGLHLALANDGALVLVLRILEIFAAQRIGVGRRVCVRALPAKSALFFFQTSMFLTRPGWSRMNYSSVLYR
jgi:hypothetical protein